MPNTLLKTPPFLSQYALEAVPRYTSYPPATKFHGGISDGDWENWLSHLPASPSLSLYVHIPFCRSMCWYCGCNTTIPNKDSRVARYLEALDREIELKASTSPTDGIVRHVHFGGGSPDMLSPARFAAIMEALRSRFTLADDAEIAVELDPRGLTADLAQTMALNGVTRASLGVQDLSEEVQKLIHRTQSEQTVREAVSNLRAAGINAINMDIMYGLPAQTVERVERMAEAVADMAPDRLAVFGYAHVPWFKKHQKAIPEDRLPRAEDRFNQMQAASRVLLKAGYEAIGFDHFAKPEDSLALSARDLRLSRNFQGYTNDNYDALIGLGASSISDTAMGFAQNEVDPARYGDAVLSGQSTIVRGVERSKNDKQTGQVIENLMCQFQVPVLTDQMQAREKLLGLQTDGLVEWQGSTLHVTDNGKPYVRNIAARLDPAFSSEQKKHSLAV